MTPRSSPNSRIDPHDDHALAEALHSGALRLLRRVRATDRALDVGPARLSALSVLVFGGPHTPGGLAEIEHVKRPTMSRIVAGLEQLGLAQREPDPDDGRGVRIRATGKGIRLMLRGRRLRVEGLVRLLTPLSANDRSILAGAARLMREMAAAED